MRLNQIFGNPALDLGRVDDVTNALLPVHAKAVVLDGTVHRRPGIRQPCALGPCSWPKEQIWHVLRLAELLLHGVVIVFAVAVDRISATCTLQRQGDIPARSEEHHRFVESWKQPLGHEGHRSLTHAHGHEDSPATFVCGWHDDAQFQGNTDC
jgi:hypothetical protein